MPACGCSRSLSDSELRSVTNEEERSASAPSRLADAGETAGYMACGVDIADGWDAKEDDDSCVGVCGIDSGVCGVEGADADTWISPDADTKSVTESNAACPQ